MKSRDHTVSPRGRPWENKSPLEGIARTVNSKNLIAMMRSWTRAELMVPFTLGSNCCAYELQRLGGPNPQGSHIRESFLENEPVESCDVLIVSGIINPLQKVYLLDLYEKMRRPRYVMAVGTCAASGAVFDTMAVDELFPVDVYISGCPPTMDSLSQGIASLKERISKGVCREEIEGVSLD